MFYSSVNTLIRKSDKAKLSGYPITFSNERIIKYSKLKQKKYRYESSLFIVEGKHLVEEAKKNNLVVDGICGTLTRAALKL